MRNGFIEADFEESDTIFNIINKNFPEILVKYTPMYREKEFNEANKDEWDYEYFIRQTFLLGRNWCVERYENCKKIAIYLKVKN